MNSIPVIAIDGPTASGKGTIASLVAAQLDFHYLDSGAIYRVLGVSVTNAALDPDAPKDLPQIVRLAADLPVAFEGQSVLLGGADVSDAIRTEQAGVMASRLAAIGDVRTRLLQRQRDFRQAPGLVADGRDMGSVVFPDSALKVFLTATAEVRAQRRHQQLLGRGVASNYDQIVADLKARDERDMNRAVAPLKPCDGAHVLDCSSIGIDEVVATVLGWYRAV